MVVLNARQFIDREREKRREMDLHRNTFRIFLEELEFDGQVYKFFDISKLNDEKYGNNSSFSDPNLV